MTWLGEDALLDRQVAIEQLLVMTTGEAGEAFQRRFREGATPLIRLSEAHPRLVRLIEAVDDERGCFLISEYVEGRSLEEVLSRDGGPMEAKKVIKLLHAVGGALEAIHAAGQVHRGLKPADILLTKAGGVKLAGAGVAALVTEGEALPLDLVRYTAPEVLGGGGGGAKVGPAADLYSLGMIAYELLVGRRAFEDAFRSVLRDRKGAAVRWMKWHTNERLTPPSASELNPNVPPILSEIVARMIEKVPARRLDSAKDLQEAIQRHFGDAKTRAEKQRALAAGRAKVTVAGDSVTDTSTLPGPRRWPWIVASLVVLLLLAGAGYGGWWTYEGMQERQRIAAADAARQTQAKVLLREADEHYVDGEFDEAAAGFERVLAEYEKYPVQVDVARAGLSLSNAQRAAEAGRLMEAMASVQSVDTKYDPYLRYAKALEAELRRRSEMAGGFDEADRLIAVGDLPGAEAALESYRGKTLIGLERDRMRALRETLAARGVQQRLDAELNKASQQEAAGDLTAAEATLAAAQEAFGGGAVSDRLATVRERREVAALLQAADDAEGAGDPAGAIEPLERAIERTGDAKLKARLATARSQVALAEGAAAYRDGDRPAARAAFLRSLSYADNAQARGWLARLEGQSTLASRIAAGDQALAAGRYEAAVQQYEAAASDADDAPADLQNKLGRARVKLYTSRGEELVRRGDPVAAKEAFEQALEVDEDAPGVAEAMLDLDIRLRAHELIDAGDAALRTSNFAAASTAYRAARELVADAPQHQQLRERVELRLRDTQRDQLLAQAAGYLGTGEIDSAEAALRTAAKYGETAASKQLWERVEAARGETR